MIDLEELKNKKEALENDKYVKIINTARDNRMARLLYTIMDNNLTTGWNPKKKKKSGDYVAGAYRRGLHKKRKIFQIRNTGRSQSQNDNN